MVKCLKGNISLPGDKSISHRALLLGAISGGRCCIKNIAGSLDVESTSNCLKQLGVEIAKENKSVIVNGIGFKNFKEPDKTLDCGNSGTTLRLLTGLLSASNIVATLDGDSSLRRRPIIRVTKPLEKMGADFSMISGTDNCPLVVRGRQLNGFKHSLSIPSAQVKTAILLAGLMADSMTTVKEISATRDHTERMFEHLGVDIKYSNREIKLSPVEKIKAFDLTIPGDPSTAAFLIVAAALIQNSELTISNLLLNPTRIGFIKILKEMGANIEHFKTTSAFNESIGEINVRYSELKPVDIDSRIAPTYIDEVPIIALAATQAEGTSIFRGLKELKVKETDRLEGIKNILLQMGGDVSVSGYDLIIKGSTKLSIYNGTCFNDHRLAMMIEIGNIFCEGYLANNYKSIINVSFSGFYQMINEVMR